VAVHERKGRVLKGYPVVTEVPVRWADMDLLGHVNNIIYLQYFETGRIAYMERAGLGPPGPAWRDHGFIVASVDCRYKTPLTYPDTVSVGARVSSMGDDRIVIQHAAFSQKLGKVAAEGDALLVSYDYASRQRMPIPPGFRAAILSLEGKELPSPQPRKRTRSKR
jgi:acyl-CoA thioester hydrolase